MKKLISIVMVLATALSFAMIKPAFALADNFYSTTFDEFELNYDCFEPNLVDQGKDFIEAKVVEDPLNSNNKCMGIWASRPHPTVPTNMVHPFIQFGSGNYTNLILRYKAYIDTNKDSSWQLALIPGNGAPFSVATMTGSTFTWYGQTRQLSVGWHDYEWVVKDGKISVSVDGDKLTENPVSVSFDVVKSLRLGVVGRENDLRPIYIDNFTYFEDSGLSDIKASMTSGVVEYGERIMLLADENTSIYYTTDGSNPTTESLIYDYESGIRVTQDGMIIKAIGVNNSGESGVYSLGKYYLKTIDSIVILTPTASSYDFQSNEEVTGNLSFLNLSKDPKTLSIVMGLYDDDVLCGISGIMSISCQTNNGEKNDFLISAIADDKLDGGIKSVRFFVLKNEGTVEAPCYTLMKSFKFDSSGNVETVEPLSFVETAEPTTLDLSLDMDSSGRKIEVNGKITSPKNGQDIVIIGNDSKGVIRIFDVIYPDDTGKINDTIPFSSSASGGNMKIAVSGKGGVYKSENKFYVNPENEVIIVDELVNDTNTADDLADCVKKYIELGVLQFVWRDDADGILFVSKEEKKSEINSITEFIDVYNKACAIADLCAVVDGDYYSVLLNNINKLDFLTEENYILSELDMQDFAQGVFETYLDKVELTKRSYATIEDCYKTAYAISKLNCSPRTEVGKILKTYNDVFKLDLNGNYLDVSEYEVAKALSGRNFTDLNSIRVAFENRVNTLHEKKLKEDGNSVSSSGGRGYIPKGEFAVNGENGQNTVNENVEKDGEICTFTDVDSSHWGYDYVSRLQKKAILSGETDGRFYPERNVTRAEFAKMIVEALNIKSEEYRDTFEDVLAEDWYAEYVCAAYDNKLIMGYNERFKPEDDISRQDMAVILTRAIEYYGKSLSEAKLTFSDKDDISDYAVECIAKLCANSILNGYNDNTFRPDNRLTRVESVAAVCRFMDYCGI